MVRNNIIKNSTSGANVLARVAYGGGTMPTNPTSRVAFVNNLCRSRPRSDQRLRSSLSTARDLRTRRY
jgi:hypothetical protein